MDRRLYEASLRGDVSSLVELLDEEPLILDRVITDFYATPLHIVAIRGHVECAIKILSMKPELASELDSQGFSPLHLASTKKNNVNMVQMLLEADPNVCNATDEDGRTPLHLAAIKNRVEIMKMLIHARPEAVQVLADRSRETILHLCVKHNRLEALKLLVEYLSSFDQGDQNDTPIGPEESTVNVNSKDDNGNTILHLAVARRQMKMIKYMLQSNIGVEVNALSKNHFTAMDIITQTGPRDLKDMEIGDLLRDAGGLKASEVVEEIGVSATKQSYSSNRINRNRSSNNNNNKSSSDQYEKWLERNHNALMVVASLIATMAFQAGLDPAGGVWQDDVKVESNKTPDTFLYSIRNIPYFDPSIDGGATDMPNTTKKFITELSKTTEGGNCYSGKPSSVVTKDEWKSIITKYNGSFYPPYLVQYAGTPVMARRSLTTYLIYAGCNTVAFLASLSVILLLASGSPLINRRVFVWILMVTTWVAITSIALTYLIALTSLIPPYFTDHDHLLQYSLIVWFGFMGLVLLSHILRFISWLLGKLGIQKQNVPFISWLLKKLGIHQKNFKIRKVVSEISV